MTCDRGVRAGLRSDERERLKALEREVRELRRANEIEAQGIGVFVYLRQTTTSPFAQAELDRRARG